MNNEILLKMQKNLRSIILVIGGITAYIIILAIYPYIQTFLFSGDDTLIFINNTFNGVLTSTILLLIPFIIFSIKKPFYLFSSPIIDSTFIKLLVIALALSGLGYFYQLNHYEYIDYSGIHVKNNFFTQEESYDFSDVNSIEVYATFDEATGKRRNSTYHLTYDVVLKDGTKINLKKSNQFWSNIKEVNDFFKSKGLCIYPHPIDTTLYLRLVGTYGLENAETIENLFSFKPDFSYPY